MRIRKSFLSGLVLSVLFAGGVTLAQAVKQEPSKSTTASDKILDRVFVIGASVSDGYGNNLPPSNMLEKCIHAEHQPFERMTSPMFFLDPENEGKRQADRALFLKASLVVGIDYLFWYCYGMVSLEDRTGKDKREENEASVQKRLALLEKGLAQLDRLTVPLVVGDIPDMFGADEQMLSPHMVPSPKALEKANQRISEWAKGRKNVLVLPLASWVQEMRSDKATLDLVAGKTATFSAEKLLQTDRLHPSQLGVVLLCSRLVSQIQNWLPEPFKKQITFDVKQAFEDIGEDLPASGSKSKD